MDGLLSNVAFGVVGTIASLLGLIIAGVQYLRFRLAKENYNKLRQMRNTQIWGSIALTLEAYDTLEEAKVIVKEREIDEDIALKIVSARKSVVAQYLRLLEQAILDEEKFTEETAGEWRAKGILENEWRYQIALKLSQQKSHPSNNHSKSNEKT